MTYTSPKVFATGDYPHLTDAVFEEAHKAGWEPEQTADPTGGYDDIMPGVSDALEYLNEQTAPGLLFTMDDGKFELAEDPQGALEYLVEQAKLAGNESWIDAAEAVLQKALEAQ